MINLSFTMLTLSAPVGVFLIAILAFGAMLGAAFALRNPWRRARQYADFVEAIAQAPHEGICVMDSKGRVTFVNRTAVSMLGWSEGDLLRKDLHRVMHVRQADCDASGNRCSLQALLQAESDARSGQATLKTSDGHTIRVAYTTRPMLKEGQVKGTIFTFRDIGEDRRAVESLQQSEERYRSLVEASPDGIVLTDRYGFTIMANARAARLYGFAEADDMLGMRAAELVVSEDRAEQSRHIQQILAGGEARAAEYTARRQDGSNFPVEIRTSMVKSQVENDDLLIHACTDISDRRQAQETARETIRVTELCAAARHGATLALAQSVTLGEATSNLTRSLCENAEWEIGNVWLIDASSNTLRCISVWHDPSLQLAELEEVSRDLSLKCGEDLPGRVWASGAPVWYSGITPDSGFLRAVIASKLELHTALCIPIFVEGSVRGVMEFFSSETREENHELVQTLSTISGQLGHFIARKEAEKALEYQARHDALTDLPNRVLLQERTERALSVAHAQGSACALLLMDLDRFKEVNDTLGHQRGDLLLQQVSLRLRGELRPTDTVARLGGDEFALLLPATDLPGAIRVAERLLKSVEEPFRLEGQRVDVGGSLGIAVYPDHGTDVQTLMQRADVAMYVAKRSKTGHAVYAAEQDEHSPDRLSLAADLRGAISRRELSVHYQPKANLATGCIESVEALARWNHPEHGFVPPDRFIPLAEQSGLIKPLGYFVLDVALRQCKDWQEAGMGLSVAVNLSTENIQDPRLVGVISNLLATHGLKADSLIVEITESTIMVDSERATQTLTELNDLGVRIAIDDFGTGYSSLAYLARLPVNEVKIDKSFVMDMTENDSAAIIARSIVDLGHNLGLQVVAEGVESQEVWNMLHGMSCDQVQGYYLSRPVPASELESLNWALPKDPAVTFLQPETVERRARMGDRISRIR